MKTTFMEYLKNFILTGMFMWVLYMALVLNSEMAGNVFIFASWFLAVSYVIAAANEEASLRVVQSYLDGKHLPEWMDKVQYTVFIMALAMWGWWFTAIAWVFIMGADFNIRARAEKIVKNNS